MAPSSEAVGVRLAYGRGFETDLTFLVDHAVRVQRIVVGGLGIFERVIVHLADQDLFAEIGNDVARDFLGRWKARSKPMQTCGMSTPQQAERAFTQPLPCAYVEMCHLGV